MAQKLEALLNKAWEDKDKPVHKRTPMPAWAEEFVTRAQNKEFIDILQPFKGQLTLRSLSAIIKEDYGVFAGPSLIGMVLRGDVKVDRWGPTREKRFSAIKSTIYQIMEFVNDMENV